MGIIYNFNLGIMAIFIKITMTISLTSLLSAEVVYKGGKIDSN